MADDHDVDYFSTLVRDLCRLPHEVEWVEFKSNLAEPDRVGQYISALANAAALASEAYGYVVWGIEDRTHRPVGTSFVPGRSRAGNEDLENWLHNLIQPEVRFRFIQTSVDGHQIVLLQVPRAFGYPVRFKGEAYIRVGSNTRRLRDFPETERQLWRVLEQTPFEDRPAASRVASADVIRLLDFQAYFDLMELPIPETREGILRSLEADGLIAAEGAGTWNITNIGAILFAKRLSDFRTLSRKQVRVILYQGNSRLETSQEPEFPRGYASGFQELVQSIVRLVDRDNETVRQGLRRQVPRYPELAVRELAANALIHQDFTIGGAGPMVEIFQDRIEITNPGAPLVQPERFLDQPPRSRNERLASLMRRLGICEERGSGIDKVVSQTEDYQLPAPLFEVCPQGTRAVLFGQRPLARMSREDRIRACYLHACLRYVNRDYMTNASLRARFGIADHNSATASRLIKEAVEAGVIRPYDESAARKLMKYVPFWA